jgi:hypothetical protein
VYARLRGGSSRRRAVTTRMFNERRTDKIAVGRGNLLHPSRKTTEKVL